MLLVFNLSCTDQGCIEADDFGEYESQTLTILANSGEDNCTYDTSLELTDTAQGSGIKDYLISGSTTVYDSDEVAYTSTTGCIGFTTESIRALCVSDAVQKCLNSAGGDGSTPEPIWTATDEKSSSVNSGVTIYADSEIVVRASGSIILGDQVAYPTSYISSKNILSTFQDADWKDKFFDTKNGQTLNVYFSGQWDDGADSEPGGNAASTVIGAGSSGIVNNLSDIKIYNGAKRTIIHAIPHPDGYSFDDTQSTEKDGTINVPLVPDPERWQCTFSSTDLTESSCSNQSYSATYDRAVDTSVNNVFPLTSSVKSSILGQFGGMIRWTNDGTLPGNYDPFSAVTCDSSGSCTSAGSLPNDISQNGLMLGDITTETLVANNPSGSDGLSYKVSFKSLHASCSAVNLSIIVKDSSDVALYTYTMPSVGSSWVSATSPHEVALEPGHRLYAQTSDTTEIVNCGEVIAAKFIPYKDIAITQSGLVSFAILNGSSGSSCTISGNIINPLGSHTDINESEDFTADFYEYSSSENPINSLLINAQTSSNKAWSKSMFVRKGQVIRLSPTSFNGTWITDNSPTGLTKQCGIGMAIKILPRPALLCRGQASDYVINPNCSLDYNLETGVLIGCRSDYIHCNDSTNATYYCPTTCQTPITCTDGVADSYKKSCTLGTPIADPAATCGAGATTATCSSCAAQMISNARSAAKVTYTLDQCYDLENYTGKVSNIDESTGFGDKLSDPIYAKGAIKLGSFNGHYGNLESFSQTEDIDTAKNNNKIFLLKTPATFSSPARLKFFLLDGADFLNLSSPLDNAYSNNSAANSSYTGTNGIKIGLTGMLEFTNGEMLLATLCDEDTGSCRSGSISDGLKKSPKIIEFDAGTTSSNPNSASNYQFNSSGSLVRTTTAAADDCDSSGPSASFFCHTHSSNDSKIRLTFKIFDPEVADCIIPTEAGGASSNDGIKLSNPAYVASAGNTGALCTYGEVPSTIISSGETKCEKQFYCANKYSNNSGKYYVLVKSTKPSNSNLSSLISSVITPVIEIMDGPKDGSKMGQSERMYKAVIGDGRYQAILSMCLVVMLTFYGVGYLMGVSQFTQSELVNRIVKVGLIYLFVSPTGWDYFNSIVVNFFKNSTDYVAFMMASSFDNSPEISQAIIDRDYYDKSILFGSVDKVFSMFFSDAVQKKVSALLFASIFGWAYLWIIYLSFMLYVYAVANAVLLYLTAQVFISILFTVAPIFFVFTLFGQTKEMFDNWLKQLISFSLQQIFLLTTLAFFNMMMYEVIKMSLGYKICWNEVWSITIISPITLMSFWTIASMPVRLNAGSPVGDIGNVDGIPSLFSILYIWVIASLMKTFITFMTDLASSIGGGLKASELGSDIGKAVGGIAGKARGLAGNVKDATVGAALRRADHALFDSGKNADAARAERKKNNAVDANNISALDKAENAAVDKLKNSAAFNSMTEGAEKNALLDKTRKDAKNKKGAELGLNEKEVNRLGKKKGGAATNENKSLAGLAGHMAGQKIRGNRSGALNDKKFDTSVSESQAQNAMREMTSEQREDYKNARNSGELKINRGTLGKMKGGLGAAGRAIKDPGSAMSSIKDSIYQSINDKKNAAKNALGTSDSEHSIARKQMEDQGKIDKMTPGTGMLRPKDQEDLIKDQMNKNKAAKKNNTKGAGNSAHQMANLDSFSDSLDNADNTEETDSHIAQGSGGVREKVFGRKKMNIKKSLESAFGIGKDDSVDKIKTQEEEGSQERLETEINQSQDNMDKSNAARNVSETALRGGTTDNYNRMKERLSDLKGKDDQSDKEKDEMNEIENDSEFQTIEKGLELQDLEETRNRSTSVSQRKDLGNKAKALKTELAGDVQRHEQDTERERERKEMLENSRTTPASDKVSGSDDE